MIFCVGRIGMRPIDFWQLTFAEFWPLYNSIMGHIAPPFSVDDLEEMEAAWAGAE
jgi:Phage tail assembly chaperone protein, TAC